MNIHRRGERLEEAYKRQALYLASNLHKTADALTVAAEKEDWDRLAEIAFWLVQGMTRNLRTWTRIAGGRQ